MELNLYYDKTKILTEVESMFDHLKFLAPLLVMLTFGYTYPSTQCISVQNCDSSKLSPACKAEREPLNLSIARKCVEFYFECGQYDKDMDAIVNKTITCLRKIDPTCNNATIFWDLDDTLFRSYYCEQKAIFFAYIPELWHAWIMRGDAKAIPQAKKLFNYARRHKFKNIIITGRRANEYDITKQNLHKEGFIFDKLIVRSPEEEKLSASEFKFKHRERIIKQENIRWVATIGDQWSDHALGCTNLKVKFPNPAYLID
jgi:hypothetical protein